VSIDLTQLTTGQIAAITASATIIAALVGGAFGLTVAAVNAWSASRLETIKVRRGYFAKALKPLFQQLDDDIVLCSEIVDVLISQTGVLPTEVNQLYFDKLRDRLVRGTIIDSTPTAIQAILRRRTELGQSYTNIKRLRHNVAESAHAVVYMQQAGRGDLDESNKEKVNRLLNSARRFEAEAVHFRERLETFMLNGG
jgi:hypothetical protein